MDLSKVESQNGNTNLEVNFNNDNTTRLTDEAAREMARHHDQIANWMWQQEHNAQYINRFVNIKMYQVVLRHLLRLYDNIMNQIYYYIKLCYYMFATFKKIFAKQVFCFIAFKTCF